jgi:hypothetical protein
MPTYFRFLALLAFKIFAAEQVCVNTLYPWWYPFCLSKHTITQSNLSCWIGLSFVEYSYAGRCSYFGSWVRRKVWCNKCGMHNLYLMNLTLCCTSSSLCKEYLPLMHF